MINLEAQPKSREFYTTRSSAINKFANMGLSGREISYAIEVETGLKIEPNDVKNLVHQARLRGTVRRLTPEEKYNIAQTTSNPWDYTDEAIRKDIESILDHLKTLEKGGNSLPTNRLDLARFRPSQEGLQHSNTKGGIQVGNKIVFPDGRHIPTFKGLSQTEKQRQTVMERSKMPKSREQVFKQSKVWSKVRPLRERLALSSEIAVIAGFTRKQVKRAIDGNSRRPEWNRVPVLTPEQIQILRKRSGKTKKPRNPKDRPSPTQDDKNSLVFAQKLLDEGLITSDLSYWTNVNELYKNTGRTLPDNFSQKLRLEILLRGLSELKKGSSETLIKYDKLGREIDDQWFKKTFAEEEGFVKAKALTAWANGEDEKGFFRMSGDGIKCRRSIFEDGEYVYENSSSHLRRIRSRNFSPNGKSKKVISG